jgi:hypothetical protein
VSAGAAQPPVPFGEVDSVLAYPTADPPVQDRDDRRIVRWSCPRCGHDSITELQAGFAAALDGEDEAQPRQQWITIYCRCPEQHPGLPADRVGCGCYIYAEVCW